VETAFPMLKIDGMHGNGVPVHDM